MVEPDPYHTLSNDGRIMVSGLAKELAEMSNDTDRVPFIDAVLLQTLKECIEEGMLDDLARKVGVFLAAILDKIDPWPISSEEHAILCCCALSENRIEQGVAWLQDNKGRREINTRLLKKKSLYGLQLLVGFIETDIENDVDVDDVYPPELYGRGGNVARALELYRSMAAASSELVRVIELREQGKFEHSDVIDAMKNMDDISHRATVAYIELTDDQLKEFSNALKLTA